MNNSSGKQAGVWIDHRRAQIVGLSPDGQFTTAILSNVEKQGRYEAQQVPADDKRQRALTGELNIYYDAVIHALHGYETLMIFGPGEAKGELHARLLKSHQGGRVSAVETADQMTEGQVVAKVRAHFGASAPRSRIPR